MRLNPRSTKCQRHQPQPLMACAMLENAESCSLSGGSIACVTKSAFLTSVHGYDHPLQLPNCRYPCRRAVQFAEAWNFPLSLTDWATPQDHTCYGDCVDHSQDPQPFHPCAHSVNTRILQT
mmetsp:Transcript_29348/g.52796  ORF Transcript_29348/g.52796 Transcript_29348/m.52796 type:complete len:121 (+) Transcript_29348:391-753(+)